MLLLSATTGGFEVYDISMSVVSLPNPTIWPALLIACAKVPNWAELIPDRQKARAIC